ncbi:MAG TPA: response regulator transcription factor [Candidatus Solibacter sp.]|nr:response regulator transcription factor [Candidatus Solibacter sp.]
MSPDLQVRVLLVEDFAPYRQFVRLTLADRPNIQVVGEASDGSEAIQNALVLQPDLILLDIGLPTLNGMIVARQIRKLTPSVKIIFLTLESSADVVQEALDLGAQGYVLKQNAPSELLSAIEAVLLGKTFVSDHLGSKINCEFA